MSFFKTETQSLSAPKVEKKYKYFLNYPTYQLQDLFVIYYQKANGDLIKGPNKQTHLSATEYISSVINNPLMFLVTEDGAIKTELVNEMIIKKESVMVKVIINNEVSFEEYGWADGEELLSKEREPLIMSDEKLLSFHEDGFDIRIRRV